MDYLQCAGFEVRVSSNQHLGFAMKSHTSLRFTKIQGLYRLHAKKVQHESTVAAVGCAQGGQDIDPAVIHQRFCHASSGSLAMMSTLVMPAAGPVCAVKTPS